MLAVFQYMKVTRKRVWIYSPQHCRIWEEPLGEESWKAIQTRNRKEYPDDERTMKQWSRLPPGHIGTASLEIFKKESAAILFEMVWGFLHWARVGTSWLTRSLPTLWFNEKPSLGLHSFRSCIFWWSMEMDNVHRCFSIYVPSFQLILESSRTTGWSYFFSAVDLPFEHQTFCKKNWLLSFSVSKSNSRPSC